MEFKVKTFVSKKSNKKISALVVDTGSREVFLSFDNALLCELLDLRPSELASLDIGYKYI